MEDLNLRPMTLGEVLDRTFRLYKSNFWLFAGITALPFLVILLFDIVVAEVVNPSGPTNQAPSISPSYLAGAMGGGLLALAFYGLMWSYAHAATIFAVSDLYLARPTTVRGSFGKIGAKVFRILWMLFLLFIGFIVGIFVLAIVVGIVAAILRSPAVVFILFFLAMIPALILFCRIALSIPIAMLENSGAFRSFGRSIQLTEGFTGQIFLIYLLAAFLMYSAVLLFQWPFLGMTLRSAASHQTLPFGIVLFQHLGTFLCQVLVGPIGTIAASLMYYNLRVRKEAFDIQHLMSSLQANQAAGPATTT